MSVGKLTGPKKAAILLLALGEDAAADVLKNLEEIEIQQVGYFMTRFTDISPEEVDIVLEEFYRNSVTQEEGVSINSSPDWISLISGWRVALLGGLRDSSNVVDIIFHIKAKVAPAVAANNTK